ncbi:fibronectin type III domain-containing protein [Paenibacillus kobensis]|uniref:fibronectin type III domain-containing protein n=1 Tax=Paenibacillus kobensis TaxID=59841 RepID=UPI000FDC9E2C|nr:fibronectin type III domain-containing protein [Paenibacillus kobensis]
MKSKLSIIMFCFLLMTSSLSSLVSAESTQATQMVQGMEGVTPPADTTITGTSFPGTLAVNAIDENLKSYWSPGKSSGTLELTFPSSVMISGLQIAAYAFPSSNEKFTIYGLKQGEWIQINNTDSRLVEGDSSFQPSILEPIAVSPDSYDGIRIDIDTISNSWVAVSEITLQTEEACNGMGGAKFPDGTTSYSGASYQQHTPNLVLDCDLSTYWDSGSNTGQVEILFPRSISINAIQLAAHSSPSEDIKLTIYGLKQGVWLQISTPVSVRLPDTPGNPAIINPLSVNWDNYNGIRIKINGAVSWAALNEVTYYSNYKDNSSFINIVPKMSSDTSPSGRVEYSSAYSASSYGYLSFDRENNVNGWTAATAQNQWISYQFDNPKVITDYSIRPLNHSAGPARSPKDWTFEAFDGANWIILDEKHNITDWQLGQPKYFTISNNNYYSKYRLLIAGINGGAYLSIGEIELSESRTLLTYNSPTNLIAQKNNSDTFFSWAKTINAAGYNVYLNGVKVNSTLISGTNYNLTGLVNGVTYSVGVSAVFPVFESAKSVIKYTPSGPSQSIVPKMLSNTSPEGLVEYSSITNSYTDGFYAFDQVYNDYGWAPKTLTNQWLSYQLSSPKTIMKYTIRPINYSDGGKRAPKDWTFEGYNGTTWVILDTQNNVSDWVPNEAKEFAVSSPGSYTKYRINVLTNNGGVYLQIGEFELIE